MLKIYFSFNFGSWKWLKQSKVYKCLNAFKWQMVKLDNYHINDVANKQTNKQNRVSFIAKYIFLSFTVRHRHHLRWYVGLCMFLDELSLRIHSEYSVQRHSNLFIWINILERRTFLRNLHISDEGNVSISCY